MVSQNSTGEEVSYKPKNSHFSGFIFFTSLEGNYINGWQYENGTIIRRSKGESSAAGTGAKLLPPQEEEECTTYETRWYERQCYEYYNGDYQCDEWVYIGSTYETYCTSTGVGGGGGVEGNSEENSNIDGLENICTKSFKFQKQIEVDPTTNKGGWQVSGVKDIHMNVVNTTTGEFALLKLPVIYFGLPIIKENGDYYSPGRSAEIASEAVEYAERKVMDYYDTLGGGGVDVVGMNLYYRQKINEYMKGKGGSASLNPGSNIGNVQITDAVYNGILGLDCL